MHMRIETARSEDIPALSELLSVLFYQEEEFTLNPDAQAKGLEQIINNPDVGAILVRLTLV